MRCIDERYLRYPFYTARWRARGMAVGRHRVRRLMKLLGLKAIYLEPRTTVANLSNRVYRYLLRGLAIERAGSGNSDRHSSGNSGRSEPEDSQ